MPKKQESAIKPPQFAKRAMLKEIPGGLLRSQEHYEGLQLARSSLAMQVAERIYFAESQFQQVDMSGTRLSRLEVLDARFSSCNLANAEWFPAFFQRVEWLTCQMTGLIQIEADMQDVLFKECKLTFAQFRFTKFKKVCFEDCDLSEADFQEADLTGVSFINCNLSNVEMSKARLKGVDLRSSQIEGLRVGQQEMQGAIINPTQAVALVQALGIVVKWPEE